MAEAALPYIATALAGHSAEQSYHARKSQKRDAAEMERKNKQLAADQAREEMDAKRSEYSNTRKGLRRSQRRGRASTILDGSDTLG